MTDVSLTTPLKVVKPLWKSPKKSSTDTASARLVAAADRGQ